VHISSCTISEFDQHRLKIETPAEIKRSSSGTGTLRPQPGGIWGQSTASFVAYCLLSNIHLPANVFAASSSGSSLRISKSLARLKLYNQNPSSLSIYGGVLLIVSDSVSRPSSISEIKSTFLADPLSRQLTNSSLLIRFSKPFVIAASPRLKELVLGFSDLSGEISFHPLSNFLLGLHMPGKKALFYAIV